MTASAIMTEMVVRTPAATMPSTLVLVASTTGIGKPLIDRHFCLLPATLVAGGWPAGRDSQTPSGVRSPRITFRRKAWSRPSCPWQKSFCRSGSLAISNFVAQPPQQVGFSRHIRRAIQTRAMAAARAGFFFATVASLIKNLPEH